MRGRTVNLGTMVQEMPEQPAVGWMSILVTDQGELFLINDQGKKFRLKMEEVVEPKEADEYPSNGLICPNCRAPQFVTPAGAVCMNGHGGITGIDP